MTDNDIINQPSPAQPSPAQPSPAQPSPAITDNLPVFAEQTINQRNLAVFQQHFPQVLEVDASGRFIINSTKLQLALDPAGVKVEEDGYEMRWVGKGEAYHTAFLPTQKILNPLAEDSKHWDSTGNLLLRGDNLEALRLLRHSYFSYLLIGKLSL